ncbi:unnamed protein product [Schistosoma mattheei]|uniref:Uncharacterized protein n=1 Tax=Schistosoma mattheei TaxID=31246 RepID=A0A183PL36_9TREM|nr:unnamed protein product [Schistosoma mattheei]
MDSESLKHPPKRRERESQRMLLNIMHPPMIATTTTKISFMGDCIDHSKIPREGPNRSFRSPPDFGQDEAEAKEAVDNWRNNFTKVQSSLPSGY